MSMQFTESQLVAMQKAIKQEITDIGDWNHWTGKPCSTERRYKRHANSLGYCDGSRILVTGLCHERL